MSEKRYPIEVGNGMERKRSTATTNYSTTLSQLQGLERQGGFLQRIRYRNLVRVLEHIREAARVANDIRRETSEARVLINELEMLEEVLPRQNALLIDKLDNELEEQARKHRIRMKELELEERHLDKQLQQEKALEEFKTVAKEDGSRRKKGISEAIKELKKEYEVQRRILEDANLPADDEAWEILEDLYEQDVRDLKESFRGQGRRS